VIDALTPLKTCIPNTLKNKKKNGKKVGSFRRVTNRKVAAAQPSQVGRGMPKGHPTSDGPPPWNYFYDPITGRSWINGVLQPGSTPGPIAAAPTARGFPTRTSGLSTGLTEALAGDTLVSLESGREASMDMFRTLVNPFDSNGEARFPDSFTMIPTATTTAYSAVALTPWNGTTAADGSTALYLRGEGRSNYYLPSSINASHTITWTSGTGGNLLGTLPANCLCRVTGCAWRLTFNAVGDIHDMVFNVMEVPPAAVVSSFTNFPTTSNVGPDDVMRGVFNARQFIVHSGETTQLTAYPMDGRCTDFLSQGSYRDGSGLSGFVAWCYGLKSTDQLVLEARVFYEFVVPSISAASATNWKTVVVKPDSSMFDKAISLLTDAQSTGLNVVKAMSSTVSNVFETVSEVAAKVLDSPLGKAGKALGQYVLGTYGPYLFGAASLSRWGPLQESLIRGRVMRANLHTFALPSLDERYEETKSSQSASSRSGLASAISAAPPLQQQQQQQQQYQFASTEGAQGPGPSAPFFPSTLPSGGRTPPRRSDSSPNS